MATLFRGDVRAWDIVEMDVAEARRGLALRLARSASLWAIGALVVAGLTIAGMDAAEAATGRTPVAGAAPVLALTAGLAAAFALVGMMARVTFQRRKRRALGLRRIAARPGAVLGSPVSRAEGTMPISLACLRPTLLAAGLFAAAVPAAAQDFSTERQQVRIDTVARGLVHPWGLGFLPDGRALVTERPGRLRIIAADGTTSPPVAGLPAIFARSQGGLLDVAVSPRFTDDRTIFFCFSEADGDLARSAMARGRLMIDGGGARLEDVRVIFRQQPATATAMHFGCRIAIRPDGTLFLTLGDHFRQMQAAQNLGSTIGKIVRVTADGAVPPDNPFVGRAGVLPEIWSFGHRNVQAAAIEPASGRLWTAEHGARHGDEINRPEAGRNYGWPVISYGTHYSGERVGEGTRREGLEQPVFHWNDETIAPSGAAFVTSARFPAWRGNMLVGGLRSRILLRLEIADGRVVATERMLGGLQERIRDVRQGPDGAIWLLTDAPDGRLLRMTPRG